VLRNFGTLTGVRIASDLFTFAFFVALSRVYGQEGLGQYSFAMALTGLFALFGDFGLTNLTIKEASRRPEQVRDTLGRILALRLLLSLASLAVLLAALPFLPLGESGRWVVLLVGAYQLAYRISNGFTAVFVARERMAPVALLEFGLRVASSLVGVAVAFLGGSLVLAVAALPVCTALETLVAFRLVARRHGAPRLRFERAGLVATAREAAPYGVSGVLFQLQSRVDVFLLGLILGVAASGVYNAAYRVVFLASYLTYYAGVALFPAATRLFEQGREELVRLYRATLRGFLLVAVPAAAGVALLAPELVALVYGPEFEASAPALRGLAALLVLSGLKNFLGFFLMSCDRQVERVRSQGWAAGFNVLAHLSLIPLFGVQGAVAGSLASELLLVALLLRGLAGELGGPRLAAPLAAAGLASAAFCALFAWLPRVPLAAVVAGSLPVYVLGLSAFPGVRRGELRMLLAWLRRRGGQGAAAPLAPSGTRP
jgi:O-antigen/teichoic acid export membrane protein